mmetsp:Transcript_36905/g.92224  ORF Transcript_36905/g.92224 Transcript_36905/m.92224 type:complete len:470 (-) Transcript_36905:465-1874(-)
MQSKIASDFRPEDRQFALKSRDRQFTLKSPCGFLASQHQQPGKLLDGSIVASRYKRLVHRPFTAQQLQVEARLVKQGLIIPRRLTSNSPRLDPLARPHSSADADKPEEIEFIAKAPKQETMSKQELAKARRVQALVTQSSSIFLRDELDSSELDFAAFKRFLPSVLGQTPAGARFKTTPKTVKKGWFDSIDVDGDGIISRGELFGLLLVHGAQAVGVVDSRKLLRSYPEFQGPSISLEEVRSVVKKNGFPPDTAEEVMTQIDTDQSGRIEFSELSNWVRRTNSILNGAKGTEQSESLGELMSQAHREKGESRSREAQARRERFNASDPSVLAINKSLDSVLTTKQDVLDAEVLAQRMRAAVRAAAPLSVEEQTAEYFASAAYKAYVRELMSWWEGSGTSADGHLSVKEMHIGLVLLGVVDGTAAAVQELFDEIDVDGGDSITLEEMQDFIVFGDDNALFRRRDNEYISG